tara:strand:- start:41021 stop:41137 length:117 start_codon:yes stop_codon:yes gene_type:complete
MADTPTKKEGAWKFRYTLVLVFNATYIILFYYLMKTFT